MSGFSTPRGQAAAQPKQISSRLLNMKFMQRAAASTSQKSATSPSTPTSEPATKRRRTGDFTTTISNLKFPSAPSTASSTPAYGDRIIISGTPYSETNGASARRGTNNFDVAGEETEWVLDVRLSNTNGTTQNNDPEQQDSDDEFEDDDDEDDDGDEIWSTNPTTAGRQTYGSFKKKNRRPTDTIPGSGTGASTPTSQNPKKRNRHEDNDDDEEDALSPLPSSNSDSNSNTDPDSSEGEIFESQLSVRPKKEPRPARTNDHPPKFDFKSEAALKRMDQLDYSKMGFEHGFGRPRAPGIQSGGSGSGGGGAGQQQQQQHQQGGKKQNNKKNKNKNKNKNKSKNRKTI